MLPDLKGKELEVLVKERAVEYLAMQLADITSCGVQAVPIGTDPDGKLKWQVIKSLPDFEGVTSFAVQFVFDCKVCSQASFNLAKYREETRGERSRQLKHMLKRSRFQVPCFFLLHWNSRVLTTFCEPAETFLFPIDVNMEFWQSFDRGEKRSITREDCRTYGVECKWSIYGNGRKPRPDLLPAVLARIESGEWVTSQSVI